MSEESTTPGTSSSATTPGPSSATATPAAAETVEADDYVELLEGEEGAGVSQPRATVREKKKTSPLWRHFEPSVDPSKAVCKHCNEKVKKYS